MEIIFLIILFAVIAGAVFLIRRNRANGPSAQIGSGGPREPNDTQNV